VSTLALSPLASWALWGGALITVTVWIVRRSRARSQRLFVDEPNARVLALRHHHINDHTQDAAS